MYESVIMLNIAGAVTDISVFVNGNLVKFHQNEMVGFCICISDYIQYGGMNEIILGVSNLRRDIMSTAYRGFKGFSAGIYGDVSIHIAKKCAVKDIYGHSNDEMSTVYFDIELENPYNYDTRIEWRLKDDNGVKTKEGTCKCSSNSSSFYFDSNDLIQWSDKHPYLYKIEIQLYCDEQLCDIKEQAFGYRLPQVDGRTILLNKTPVLLRGLTEHAYFPQTCTAPMDKAYYRFVVKKYKEIGFNWIRFHTTIPHEYYLDACDELGMLVQVEVPNYFRDFMWTDMLMKCRKHPSVILYCGGNEMSLTDEMLIRLEEVSKIQKEVVPDSLFSPMQALAYVEWLLNEKNVPIEDNPIPHNPVKMKWVQKISDVLQPQKDIGFSKMWVTWQELEPVIDFYEKPYTSHEVGIRDSYINLDLEKRYEGTRIGAELYRGAREYLIEEGLIDNAALYYKNSCLWSAAIRKVFIEKLRLCKNVSGYDYLGAIDCHWHRTGYSPGILNEFHEYKPGENRKDILRYNGESIIMLDMTVERNVYCGEEISYNAFASIYGEQKAENACFTWRLLGEDNKCYVKESVFFDSVKTYEKSSIGNVKLAAPMLEKAEKCILQITLECDKYYIENEYSIWIFPKVKTEEKNVIVCRELDQTILEKINNGASVLILNALKMKKTPLSHTKMLAGRTVGNTSTVIYDHPMMRFFPHEGWCDFQFYNMFESADSVVFDEENPLPFNPIIEIVSSYKNIIKQSVLFEFTVGKGKVVVCTLNMCGNSAEKVFLYDCILRYMNSEQFTPKDNINFDEAEKLLFCSKELKLDYSQDIGMDGNALF